MAPFHLMLFDLYTGGHHAHHLLRLAEYWVRFGIEGRLSIVVPEVYREKHPRLTAFADVHQVRGVTLVPIEEVLEVERPRRLGLLRNSLDHTRIARTYIERLRPDHCLFLFLDHMQLGLAADLRFRFPVGLSGILFRPSMHYAALGFDEADARERLNRWRKRLTLQAAMRNPHLSHVFTSDPFAVEPLQRLSRSTRVVLMPDGIEENEGGEEEERLRDPERKTFLLFGALDDRKGLRQVLEAALLLPAEVQRQTRLSLVGRLAASERSVILTLLDRVRAETRVRVDLDDRFVEDEEIQPLIRAADVVLVTYQRHVGTSGVLVRAAMGERPVIGSRYGVVGEQIRRYGLGIALDATDPSAIADAITDFVSAGACEAFEPERVRRFASENTMQGFAATLLKHTGALRAWPVGYTPPALSL